MPPSTDHRPRRHDPLMLAVVACGVVIGLLALATGGLAVAGVSAYLYAFPIAPTDPSAVLGWTDDQVEALRGLDYTRPISFALMTSDELRRKVEVETEEDWSLEEAEDDEIELAALDFLDRDSVDLYTLMQDLHSSAIAGYYDSDDKSLYVISDAGRVDPMQRTTLAHELTHVLQDQHFGLDRLSDEGEGAELDSEARLAFRALAEGDASLLDGQYTDGETAPHERLWIVASAIGQAMDFDWDLLTGAPSFIMDSMFFPYNEGEAFVRDLYDEGGWDAVDEAYADPPLSSEHILHPDRYRDGDHPRTVSMVALTETLGSRWRWVDEDVVGEFALREHIATAITPTLAAVAAEGWGGDRYVVFHDDRADETVLLLRTVWDSPEDADEFLNLYWVYLSTRFGGMEPYLFYYHAPVNSHMTENLICWEDESDARCLWREGEDAISVVRAPRASIAERVYRAVSGIPEETSP